MDLLMEQLKKEELNKLKAMLTKIQQLFNLYHRLSAKVNCVCNRPNLPQPPTENGTYFLNVTDGVWTWTNAI